NPAQFDSVPFLVDVVIAGISKSSWVVRVDNNATVTYDPAFNEEPTLPGSSTISYALGRWE
ncbi:MAG TPA: hypothetical protein GX699_06035, partial [Firmicutes bacterium]|nr:hypothetical protein [Bacillota bacterium]